MENLCEHNCPSIENLAISIDGGQVTTSRENNNFSDTWKIRILQNTRIISTIEESIFIIDKIVKFAENDKEVVVSVDCEGVNLGVNGKVTLIDVGTTGGDAFIFDILTCPEMITDGGLKKLLEHSNVIKIIHDCRNDSINLYQQFGILLRNVFDTQSAHTVLQFQDNQKKNYKAKCALNSLCEIYNAPINPMKDLIKKTYKRNQNYWAKRPLTRDMLLYAAGDVLVLINEQLYGNMSGLLKPEFKQLFSELCTEQILDLIKRNYVKIHNQQCNITTEVLDKKERAKDFYKVTRNPEPTSLIESIHLMKVILSDTSMSRITKFDKLEAILSFLPNDKIININSEQGGSNAQIDKEKTGNFKNCHCTYIESSNQIGDTAKAATTKESQASQTLSSF